MSRHVIVALAALVALLAAPAPSRAASGAASRSRPPARANVVAAVPAPVDSVKRAWTEARQLTDAGEHERALAVLDQALRAHPGNVDLTWLEAAVYGYSGNHREAVARYERLLQAHPELARDVRKDLAIERLRADDYAGAIRDFDLRVAEDPTDRESRSLRAAALSYADRNREALAAYDELVREDPSDLSVAMERARVLGWMGRHREAIAAYRGVLARDPSQAAARLGLAQNENWAGHHRRAAALFDSIAASGERGPEVQKGLAFAHYWSGHPGRAQAVLDPYLASAPSDIEARDLADRIARERTPGFRLGYGRSDDSDEQRIETRSADVRLPLPSESAVLLGWRRNTVSDPGGVFNPTWITGGFERTWGDLWIARGSLGHYLRDSHTEAFGVGEASLTWRPTDPVRLDLGYAKDVIDTRLATELGIVARTWVAGIDDDVNDRLTLHADARWRDYSDGNHAVQWAGAARTRLHAERRWRAYASARVERLHDDQDLDHGYYDPDRYIEGGPGLELELEPNRIWSLGADARTGWQRENDADAKPFYNVSGSAEVIVHRLFLLRFEAGRSNSNLSSASGFEVKRWAVSLSRSFFHL